MATIINTESNVTCRKTSKTGYMFKLEVIVNSYDSANNYWNVTINHYSYGYNGKWYYNTTGPTSAISTTIDGTATTRSSVNVKGIQKNSYQQINTWTGNIYANDDGNKTVTFSAKYTNSKDVYYGEDASGYMPKTNTISQTVNMPTIPRKSSFTYSGTTLASATNVSISRASNSFTHTLVYTMGNISQSYTGLTTSASFTRPYTDAQQFGTNNASGTGTLTLITYNGGTEIGRVAQNIVMNLPDNNDTKPVRNTTTAISDSISAISTKFGALIQNQSRPQFVFDYSGRYGANISSYNLNIGGKVYTSSTNTIVVDTIQDSGSINYSATIRDTRGRTITETGIISMLAYAKPQADVNIERTSTGTSASVKINASITPLNNLNDKLLQIKYKPHTSSTYQSQTVTFDSGYTMDKTVQIPISENLSYDFYIAITDFFGEEDTAIIPISTVFDLLHFGADGESIAVGKRVERNGCFEVGMDLYYQGMRLDDYIRQIINERND